jgi:hypothetical protein
LFGPQPIVGDPVEFGFPFFFLLKTKDQLGSFRNFVFGSGTASAGAQYPGGIAEPGPVWYRHNIT